jgi:hypothetical protein
MTNPVSFVELGEQHVVLLPARTVLSLLSVSPADGADGGGQAGPNGNPGQPGEAGQSIQGDGRTITYDPAGPAGDSTDH